jgi:3-deoxy-7-phosphoheptulonate synthase
MDKALLDIPASPALQQPHWPNVAEVEAVRADLRTMPGLVDADAVWTLRAVLTGVASGEALVVQAGDCAEDPAECAAVHVARKVALLDALAGVLEMKSHKQVVRVGRIAGQFAKPRSTPVELVGDVQLPVYRGHMVNSPEPTLHARMPDPYRLLSGYYAARKVVSNLGWNNPEILRIEPPVWISHDALLLDYEISMLRRDATAAPMLASTHWPWIGERTRQVDGPHVALLADVINPVACKVGPKLTVEELIGLCDRLDPDRVPGRLTLIARMGADMVAEKLPPLVSAVHTVGHPVIWLCDPMHGNTVSTPDGRKTRFVETIVREIQQFIVAVEAAGGVAGGLHLETTPAEVTECVSPGGDVNRVGDMYTTFCDPRLNSRQAIEVVAAWR